MLGNLPVGDPHQISASANVLPSDGALLGIFVSAASAAPTITIYDSATNTTTKTIVSVFTPVAGTYYPLPMTVQSGCYIVITGTVSLTAVTAP